MNRIKEKRTLEEIKAEIGSRLDAFCVTDEHYNILVANVPYCILTGYMPDELLYMNTRDLVAIAEYDRAAASTREPAGTKEPENNIWTIRTKGNELVPVYVTVMQLELENKQRVMVGMVEPLNEGYPLDFPIL